MKGPGLRNELEIRRTFRCPACGRTVKLSGNVVSEVCNCSNPPVWMQIQPDPPRREFKFEKVEIPLTEEDLVVRERPRRMPPPPPEGAVETPNDRKNSRPKRPKPERRSFESFQEDLAAKVEAEAQQHHDEQATVVEVTSVEITTAEQITIVEPVQSKNEPDEFGEGL